MNAPPPLPVSLPPVPGELRAGAVLIAAARIVSRNAHVLLPLAFLLALPGAAAQLAWPDEERWEQLAVALTFEPIQAVVLAAAVLPASLGGAASVAGLRAAPPAALAWALCAAAVPVVTFEMPMPGVFGAVQPFAAFAVQVVLWVAVPVALVERDAGAWVFVRSLRLTEGCRWSILLVVLAITVVVGLPSIALVLLRWLPPTTVPAALVYAGLVAFLNALHAAASVAAYRLRVGPEPERRRLASVFE